MKQIIEKDPNGSICWKTNWVNDKIFGIGNWCDTNNKQTILRYHL